MADMADDVCHVGMIYTRHYDNITPARACAEELNKARGLNQSLVGAVYHDFGTFIQNGGEVVALPDCRRNQDSYMLGQDEAKACLMSLRALGSNKKYESIRITNNWFSKDMFLVREQKP